MHGKALIFFAATCSILCRSVLAECPNACSGKGECSKHDECVCYIGYMSNDCSQRICPFGHAHVDGSKGDLNGDNMIGSNGLKAGYSDDVVINSQVYSLGTSEGVEDLVSNSGHSYMECSNKGLCNRNTGVCQCFDAYEGSACQRASCPNKCSSRGLCLTLRELVNRDYSNVYEIWDSDQGMACLCDPGYAGFDCSERVCPMGVDPLYKDDDSVQPRTPTWNFRIKDPLIDFTAATLVASAKIEFYDISGENWITDSIDLTLTSTDTEKAVEEALKSLPNDVIPPDTAAEKSIECTDSRGTNLWLVTCKFNKLFGSHRVPKLIVKDSSGRSTITLPSGASIDPTTVTVYDSGFSGESVDYFGNLCSTLTVQVTAPVSEAYYMGTLVISPVTGTTAQALSALKTCLGDSDGDTTNDVDAERWDTGSYLDVLSSKYYPGEHPHMVKLVPVSAPKESIHAIIFFDGTNFHFLNKVPFGVDYYISATNGFLSRIYLDSATSGVFDLNSNAPALADTMAGVLSASIYATTLTADADISCTSGSYKNCLVKGDLIVVPSTYLNDDPTEGYTSGTLTLSVIASTDNTAELREVKKIESISSASVITLDRPLHYAADFYVPSSPSGMVGFFPIFKFTPNPNGINEFKYVSECSGRGLCNSSSGICKCFKGYTGYNCDKQSTVVG